MAIPGGQKKHKQPAKNRKNKTYLEFDEKARSEYLKGFQKRKIERKKIAREKHDKKILDERKQLLKQVRESQKDAMRKQPVVIPEIQDLVEPEVYDLPDHTVTISDIGEVDYVGKSGLRLGLNSTDKADETEMKVDNETKNEGSVKPVKNSSLKQKLASCSNQLSSQKLQIKKQKKKQMLKQKMQQKLKKKGK